MDDPPLGCDVLSRDSKTLQAKGAARASSPHLEPLRRAGSRLAVGVDFKAADPYAILGIGRRQRRAR